jgi:hypothetical protein
MRIGEFAFLAMIWRRSKRDKFNLLLQLNDTLLEKEGRRKASGRFKSPLAKSTRDPFFLGVSKAKIFLSTRAESQGKRRALSPKLKN